VNSDIITDSDRGTPTDLQNILVNIASIGQNADRDTLIFTIDQSIEAIIVALLAEKDPTSPAPELTKTAASTMEFLEACAETDDEEFRAHIANRARELLAVLTSGKRPEAEPEPVDPSREVRHDVFEEAFADYFCDYIYSRLHEFHADQGDPSPAFILKPAFADRFVKAVREFVLPGMITNRRIRNMSDSVAQKNFHQAHFFKEFNKPEEENVVRLIWGGIMEDFRSALQDSEPVVDEKKTKPEKKKSGLLSGLKKKKEKSATKSAKTVAGSNEKADGFWKILQEGTKAGEYDAPLVEDFAIFAVLMDYYQEVIDENKDAIRQLLEQETGGEDDEMEREGREGGTRDWFYKMVPNLPPHLGELLVLWCFHNYKELFKPSIAKSFLAGQGTSDDARQRAVPFFFRWFNPEDYPDGDDNPFADEVKVIGGEDED
jgi:hypothetical protein